VAKKTKKAMSRRATAGAIHRNLNRKSGNNVRYRSLGELGMRYDNGTFRFKSPKRERTTKTQEYARRKVKHV